MDLRQITHFLAVVEHGSVGRAAEHLHITQPALSKSIRRLEEDLQVKLFERGPEGMSVTLFGSALAERARFVSLEMKNVVQELDDLRGLYRGSVVVGGGPSIVGDLLASATARLTARRPEIHVTVIEGLYHTLLPGLRSGEIDFLIGSWSSDLLPDTFRCDNLLRDEVAVFARAGHPLAGQRDLDLTALASFPWTLANDDDSLRRHLAEAFAAAGLIPPRPKVISGSARFMKALLLKSDCLTYLPRLLTEIEEAAGLLVPLQAPAATWRRKVQIARRVRGTLPPAGRALLVELKQVCAEKQGTLLPA